MTAPHLTAVPTTAPAEPGDAGPAVSLIETPTLRACVAMAAEVMRSDTRVGRILGEPGTGKTQATRYLCEVDPGSGPGHWRRAVRVCCRRGMSEAGLARTIAAALGADCRPGAATDTILDQAGDAADGSLLILDEANHLRWQHLERLRWFSDECGAGLILVGTDLLHRTFLDGRNQVYLAQLTSRIGTKQVRFSTMDAKATAAYCLVPRFGPVSAEVGRAFHAATAGNWRVSQELAAACARVMEKDGLSLSLSVIGAAQRWLAKGTEA